MRKNYTYPFVFLALAAVAPLHLQAAAEGEAETEVELVDAELAAARGSLTGVVLDDARHAVPGAVVYIRSLNLGVVSGTDGSSRFTPLSTDGTVSFRSLFRLNSSDISRKVSFRPLSFFDKASRS